MSSMPELLQINSREKPKIVVAIPAYNEEKFIAEVVHKARIFADEVVVVDDGSQDDTYRVAKAAGALVLSHRVNKGYGEVIRSCFRAAKTNDADILVTIDGDNQHNSEEISAIVAPILNNEADMVIGSRFLTTIKQASIPRYRKLGIRLITWLYNLNSKNKISDAQSGFRAYSRKLLNDIYTTEKGMGISIEILLKARERNFVIEELPISCSYHAQSSTLNPTYHGLNVTMTMLKLVMMGWLSRLIKRIRQKS